MTDLPHLLIVDDDPLIQESLSLFFRLRGYDVESAPSAREALAALARSHADLVVLDLGLPDMDGRHLCERIRQTSDVPIIVLSARAGEKEKVAALEGGADDYLTKPFSSDELLARVHVALRRGRHASGTGRIERGSLLIDFDRRRVRVDGREVRLTPKEFDLLVFLARHPNRVIPHQVILTAIWGVHAADRPEQLWALVTKVRRKIEPNPDEPQYLVSEPWVGYRLVTDADPLPRHT
ncbi:MAG TPA: response regulator transcription factor [Vicinamibacterales bacterium]|nr:response regulator transcription factor [Vicinamibacterales bacterium]